MYTCVWVDVVSVCVCVCVSIDLFVHKSLNCSDLQVYCRHGPGNWKQILNTFPFKRTAVDLKDKWRNMIKRGIKTMSER